ncbi:hypothetical protein HPB52_015973 [Rhipicephalus sanguineus]|uniref:Uncharacterized protein n=1 Tax=Rhipicephalus sanguineus TaxID=34632 RepID=A0A9D4PD74_RHISA|nr:hypothetical protein HPB52_015973 [Rhipicephalus sanguineus]
MATATTTGSPATFAQLAEASTTPGVRPEPAGSAFHRVTSTAVGASSERPTQPDATRQAALLTTMPSREPSHLSTTADFNKNEASLRHTTGDLTSTAVTGTSSGTSSSTAPAATDIIPRQAVAESIPPPDHSGVVGHIRSTPASASQIVETTNGRASTSATTGTPPVHLQTSTNETEFAVTRPAGNAPTDNASSKAAPSALPETTKQPPSKLATSPLGTRTTAQVVLRAESRDFKSTQATTTSSAVSQVSELSGHLETVTDAPSVTIAPLNGISQNHTALTRAAVDDGNQTYTPSRVVDNTLNFASDLTCPGINVPCMPPSKHEVDW